MAERARDDDLAAYVLGEIASSYQYTEQPDSAIKYYRLALKFIEDSDDPDLGTWRWLSAKKELASVFMRSGATDSALAQYRDGAEQARQSGDWNKEAEMLLGVVEAYRKLGREDSVQALVPRAKALQDIMTRAAPSQSDLLKANMDRVLATWKTPQGQSRSLALVLNAAKQFRSVGDSLDEGAAYAQIGALYGEVGQIDSARFYFQKSISIGTAAKLPSLVLSSLVNLAEVYRRSNADSALHYHRLALANAGRPWDRAQRGFILAKIAEEFLQNAKSDSAKSYARRAIKTLQRTNEGGLHSRALEAIATAYELLGQRDSAEDYLAEAVNFFDAYRSGDYPLLARIADFYRRSPRPQLTRAVVYYDSAVSAADWTSLFADIDDSRVTLREEFSTLVENWTFAWLALGDSVGREASFKASLAALEKGRGRALLTRVSWMSALAAPSTRDEFIRNAPSSWSRLGDFTERKTLSYLVSRDTLVAWLQSHDKNGGDQIESWRTAISRDSLAALIAAARIEIVGVRPDATPSLEPATRGGFGQEAAKATGSLKALSRVLLPEAMRSHLKDSTSLVVIPNGALAVVPFAALILDDSGSTLGSAHSIQYAPSTEVLRALEEGDSRLPDKGALAASKGVVFGNPVFPDLLMNGRSFTLRPLPGAEKEARDVAAILGVSAIIGKDATESALKQRLNEAAVVHLATHGFAYNTRARAGQSFVALTPGSGNDGFLTVAELMSDSTVKMSGTLVALSACETGLGNISEAEGTLGLARAFIAKGAKTVLVSLWNVSDNATTILMERFYAHWRKDSDKPTKSESLRRAQNDVRGTTGFADAKFWAPFQLIGAQ
jgi:tetratricopeptide (TPR) repeat protein